MSDGILVLGLGNELFTDEGVGVVASRLIEQMCLPGVEVVDGGTLGLALLPTIEGRRALLILDALLSNELPPGEVVVLDGDFLRREARLLYSAHQLGVNEVLAATDLVGVSPGLVAAIGMVPASVGTGYGLTSVGETALPSMVDRAVEILAGWGVREAAHA